MWGFFESILKIGFGVVFGFLVYDTMGPISGVIGNNVEGITNNFPWWSLIIIFPLYLLLFIGSVIFPPFIVMLPFFMIGNKLLRGDFSKYPESWHEGDKEYLSFLVVWICGFWAVIFKFGVIE